jgi:hypothetical protein
MRFEQAGLLKPKPPESITNNHSQITNNQFFPDICPTGYEEELFKLSGLEA